MFTTHSAYDAEHIVVCRVHAHSRALAGTNSLVGDIELESGVINTGQIASAAGLVLLRVKSKGVHVHTNSRDIGVVLVRLYFIEVAALTHLEAIMAVELEES